MREAGNCLAYQKLDQCNDDSPMKTPGAAFFVSLLLFGWPTGALRAGLPPSSVKLDTDGEKIPALRQTNAVPAVPATDACEDSWSVVASLNWGAVADWDLHLDTPNAHVYWNNREDDGFILDRDAYPICNPTPVPPEQITGNGKCGTYKVYSNLFSTCGGSPQKMFSATVTALKPIKINGTEYNVGETFSPHEGDPFIVAANGCVVQPLAPLTDPLALRFEAGERINTERLSKDMRSALSCFQQAVTNAGGTFVLKSAYRPSQYQGHLLEIYNKLWPLRESEDENCQALKSKVEKEFSDHELQESQEPASPTGPHTRGAAIDVSVNPTITGIPVSTMVSLGNSCGLHRPPLIVATDPTHFELGPSITQFSALEASPKATKAAWSQLRGGHPSPTGSLQISVRGSVEDLPNGMVRYRYTVSNNSTQDIVGVFVGYDNEVGTPELLNAPVGWTFEDGVPASSMEEPVDWNGIVVTKEEVPFLSLRWIANDGIFGLHPGTSSSSFAALLEARHTEFLSVHWAAILADGQIISGVITPSTQLGNISTRLRVETGDNALIGGFIVTGIQSKKIILRAMGPSLPLAGALSDPVLELRNSSGGLIAFNDDWRTDQQAEIIATGIPPGNILESAIVATLPANNSAYTAIVHGYNNATGIGVVEAYDLDQTVNSTLANISTRGFVSTGDNVMIGGTIILGSAPANILFRAIGPSLTTVGVPNALPDPTLELRDSNGALIAFNDDWRTDQQAEIIATGIPPTNILESAILRSLSPGAYTAIVQGYLDSTGVGLVEAYQLQ